MHVVPEGGEVARKLVLSLDAVSTRKLMLRSTAKSGANSKLHDDPRQSEIGRHWRTGRRSTYHVITILLPVDC
jgi:hypothetical protein